MKPKLTTVLASLFLAAAVGCSTSSPKAASSHRPAPIATEVEDGRVLYEMGRLDVAEQKLQAVMQQDPDNLKARYYLGLVHEAQARNQHRQPWGYYQTIPQQPIYR